MEVYYVDTSAIIKLIRSEPESAALTEWLAGRQWVIGDLHRTELRRAARRAGARTAARAERLMAEVDIVTVDGTTFDLAGRLEPPELRSLDAIHLACAQALAADLAGLVAYDKRLLDAAESCGITAISPRP